MTYAELARARGIDKASAAKLVLRRKWRRQKDNHGVLRVLVPAEWTDMSRDMSEDDTIDVSPDMSQTIRTLEQAVASGAEREKQLRAERDAERIRADAAEHAREEARVRAAESESELKGLREALAEARRPFWRRWLGVVALCTVSGLLPAVASAQVNPHSATSVMPGCRAHISADPHRQADYSMGLCMGIVRGISFMEIEMCAPGGVTQGQMLRVVVHYIDARPARLHESFEKLASEAFRAAWPCRR